MSDAGRPGVKGNKCGGRKAMPEFIRMARQKKCTEFWAEFFSYCERTRKEVAEIASETSKKTMWQICAARTLLSFASGEPYAVRFVENQVFGEPVKSVAIYQGNLESLDASELDKVLAKAISGEIQLSPGQIQALRIALQKQGQLPDPFNNFQVATQDQLKTEAPQDDPASQS